MNQKTINTADQPGQNAIRRAQWAIALFAILGIALAFTGVLLETAQSSWQWQPLGLSIALGISLIIMLIAYRSASRGEIERAGMIVAVCMLILPTIAVFVTAGYPISFIVGQLFIPYVAVVFIMRARVNQRFLILITLFTIAANLYINAYSPFERYQFVHSQGLQYLAPVTGIIIVLVGIYLLLSNLSRFSISERLRLGFGVLLFLVVVLGGASLVTNNLQTSAIEQLQESNDELTLIKNAEQQAGEARLSERNFLLRQVELGVESATEIYLLEFQNNITESLALLDQIAVTDEGEHVQDVDHIANVLITYDGAFASAVDAYIERNGSQEGLITKFTASAEQLQAVLPPEFFFPLQPELLELRRVETVYVLSPSSFNANAFRRARIDLRAEILASIVAPGQREAAENALEVYTENFNALVEKDEEIVSRAAIFNAWAVQISPSIATLGEVIEAEQAAAQSDFDRVATLVDVINALLLILAIPLGLGLAYVIQQSIVLPLVRLTEVASDIGAGDLSRRAENRHDEIGVLANTFNNMAQQLQNLISGLESRVAERTHDLETTIRVGQLATSMLWLEDLLPSMVEFIQENFDLYYTQIYLLDEAGRFAVLRAGTGEAGRELLVRDHKLEIGKTSIVSQSVLTREPVLVSDTIRSDIHRPNPLLPDTRSELSIPLIVAGDILGVLDMQAVQEGTFTQDNLSVYQAMGNQVAAAIGSALAFAGTQEAIDRADALNRRLTQENWEQYLDERVRERRIGYQYDLETPVPLEHALSESANGDEPILHQSIALRGQSIGMLMVKEDREREWLDDEVRLMEDVAERVAQTIDQMRAADETQLALAQTRAQARSLARLNEISEELSRALDEGQVYHTIAQRVTEVWEASRSSVVLLDPDGETASIFVLYGSEDVIPAGHKLPVHNSMIGTAIREGQIMFTSDLRGSDWVDLKELEAQGMRSAMSAPITVSNEVIGTLNVATEQYNAFKESDRNLMRQIVSLVGGTLEISRLFEQIATRATELQTVAEVSAEAASTLDANVLLKEVADLTKERFEHYHAHIYLLDAHSGQLKLTAGAGAIGDQMVQSGHSISLNNTHSLVARAARESAGVISSDVGHDLNFLPNPMLPLTRSEMAIPLIVGQEVIGVLDVQSQISNRFSDEEFFCAILFKLS